jgi:hypothetical protein
MKAKQQITMMPVMLRNKAEFVRLAALAWRKKNL